MPLKLFTGFDWLGFSVGQAVDRRAIADLLAIANCYLPDEWIDGKGDGDRFGGVGCRAILQGNRWRVDMSGGFWPLDYLTRLFPALATLADLRVHRFDLAGEPSSGGEKLYRQLKRAAIAGNYGGFEKASVVESWDGGVAVGETLYLGSRESPSFSRYYRKRGRERYRLEREFKRARALQSLESLALGEDARLWLFGGLVFGKKDKSHRHLSRVTPFSWWESLSGLSRFERLPPLPPVERSLERSLAWVEKSVAPTWRTLQLAGYCDRLRDVVAAATPKSAMLAAMETVV